MIAKKNIIVVSESGKVYRYLIILSHFRVELNLLPSCPQNVLFAFSQKQMKNSVVNGASGLDLGCGFLTA